VLRPNGPAAGVNYSRTLNAGQVYEAVGVVGDTHGREIEGILVNVISSASLKIIALIRKLISSPLRRSGGPLGSLPE
jgi:hypothetical protein